MTVQYPGRACWPHEQAWREAVQPLSNGQAIAIHRAHADAFLARAQCVDAMLLVVIDGAIEISSYRGRERLGRGALAIRPTFDCRTLRAGPDGAAWLQLPWPKDGSLGATYDAPDLDALLLGHDLQGVVDAVAQLRARLPSRAPLRLHWIDDLKDAILIDPHLSISEWARTHRVSREGAARAFRAAYAVSPARFRLEMRARRAWCRIVSGGDPLSMIALETGFADQSHMTRAVGWLTGRPPSAWRKKP